MNPYDDNDDLARDDFLAELGEEEVEVFRRIDAIFAEEDEVYDGDWY